MERDVEGHMVHYEINDSGDIWEYNPLTGEWVFGAKWDEWGFSSVVSNMGVVGGSG